MPRPRHGWSRLFLADCLRLRRAGATSLHPIAKALKRAWDPQRPAADSERAFDLEQSAPRHCVSPG